jgi:hypothetical protein
MAVDQVAAVQAECAILAAAAIAGAMTVADHRAETMAVDQANGVAQAAVRLTATLTMMFRSNRDPAQG